MLRTSVLSHYFVFLFVGFKILRVSTARAYSSTGRKVLSMKNTLIVSTRADLASENIANSLKHSYSFWKPIIPDKTVYRSRSGITGGKVWLWIQDAPLLHMNHVDELFKGELTASGYLEESSVDDVIFLSKHCAASGKASLTVHPIGIPWCADATVHGGFPGRCSPPSERIAPLYRSLLSECKSRSLNEKFEVTLEATHHGPFVSVPACFVEIGSSEAEWDIPEAGDIWAHCLVDHLKLTGEEEVEGGEGGVVASRPEGEEIPVVVGKKLVMVLIGGGHYVPKMNDAARLGEGMYTGHALASYTLQKYFDGTEQNPVEGGWQHIVKEMIDSTRITHPDADIICLVDKKAFGSANRHAIIGLLGDMGIRWTHNFSDVKALWQSTVL